MELHHLRPTLISSSREKIDKHWLLMCSIDRLASPWTGPSSTEGFALGAEVAAATKGFSFNTGGGEVTDGVWSTIAKRDTEENGT